MTITATDKLRTEIANEGFAKTGDIGGQPKQTYWTPDGRMIQVAPSWHEYAQRDGEGKVLKVGVRDANLDKGWLLKKPDVLSLYCPHCDMWHQRPQEIRDCEKKRNVLLKYSAIRSRKAEQPDDEDRLTKVEADIAEVKELLRQLVRGSEWASSSTG